MTGEPPPDLSTRIDALDDRRAIQALAAIAERHGYQPDTAATLEVQARVDEALHQPDLADLFTTNHEPATTGDIARLTLNELAHSDTTTAADINHAIDLPDAGERFDPATLAIGALVLFAFHADISLQRDPDKGWTFKFRTKPLKESTIGSILSKLLTGAASP